jgi:predicted transcriptional regulator
MTVEQLKAEAAKLSSSERRELAEWIEQSADIQNLRRDALISDVRAGLDDLARGEFVQCENEAELRNFFDGVKARGREMLNAKKDSVA